MCIVFVALQSHPRYPLILAVNRDEYFSRSTKALHRWGCAPFALRSATNANPTQSDVKASATVEKVAASTKASPVTIAAGQDEQAGGTQFGARVTAPYPWTAPASGAPATTASLPPRAAVVTNFRELWPPKGVTTSRGHLVTDALGLTESDSSTSFTAVQDWFRGLLEPTCLTFSGFNLLVAEPSTPGGSGSEGGKATSPWMLRHCSNRRPDRTWGWHTTAVTEPGVYCMSNAGWDTPWPKAIAGKSALSAAIADLLKSSSNETLTNASNADKSTVDAAEAEAIARRLYADVLSDSTRRAGPNGELPQTGLPSVVERHLSAVFVEKDTLTGYGTRTSSVVMYDTEGRGQFFEWTHTNGVKAEVASFVRTDLNESPPRSHM